MLGRTGRIVGSALMLAVVVAGQATVARAENAALDAARAAYDDLDYEKVLPLLKRALATATDLRQEAETYLLMAELHVMRGEREPAIAAFIEVLGRQPSYEPPEHTSPKLLEVWREAQKRMAPVAVEPSGGDEPEASSDAITALGPEASAPTETSVPALDAENPEPAPAFYESGLFWGVVSGVVVATAASITIWQLSVRREPDVDFFFELPK